MTNLALPEHANKNYSRELMQLFTLGLNLLNDDGTAPTRFQWEPDSHIHTGKRASIRAECTPDGRIPTQRAGKRCKSTTRNIFIGPHGCLTRTITMERPNPSCWRTVRVAQPASRRPSRIWPEALDDIFNQPECGAVCFQATDRTPGNEQSEHRLCEARGGCVCASGSVQFWSVGSGQRGDLQAVIAAILLDPEARENDDPTAGGDDRTGTYANPFFTSPTFCGHSGQLRMALLR